MDFRFLATPRWLFLHLLIGSMVVGMIWAAFWQWGRLGERRELNALLDQRAAQEAVSIEDVLAPTASGADVKEREWTTVLVDGAYGDSVAAGNQQRGAVLELRAVTLPDDTAVLVMRGRRPETVSAVLVVPGQEVVVTGALRQRPGSGPLSVDLNRLVEAISADGSVVRPGYVQMQASAPAPEPFLELVPLPDRTEGSHLSYTGQWCIFAFLCALGYGLMIRRTARERGRAAAIVGGRDDDI